MYLAATTNETNQKKTSSLANDSSLILNILSGLNKEEIPKTENASKLGRNLNILETKNKKKLRFEKIRKLLKEKLQANAEDTKNTLQQKSDQVAAEAEKVFEIKKTNKSFFSEENAQNAEKTKIGLNENYFKEKKPKAVVLQEITIKYSSVLNYTFMASISRKNLIDLATIELDRFMNSKIKEYFFQNLAALNEMRMLAKYLRFNTISAFEEIGEIGTNIKRLSAFLSFNKIGSQFLIIKNDYFTNKILILFHKDSFPFSYFPDDNKFYVIKVDKDFLCKNYFGARYEKTSVNKEFDRLIPYKTDGNIIANQIESRLKLQADMEAKCFTISPRIKPIRRIKNTLSCFYQSFRIRKISKIQEGEKRDEDRNYMICRQNNSSSQFRENFEFGNNLINNNNDILINNCNEKLLLINCFLLNNANANNNSNKNPSENAQEYSFDSIAGIKRNKSQDYFGSLGTSNCSDLNNRENNLSKSGINPFSNENNKSFINNRIKISLDSFQVIHDLNEAGANNQLICYENKYKNDWNNKSDKIELEEIDGNYNINYI